MNPRHDPVEIAETEALLAEVERQIEEQRCQIEAMRLGGWPSKKASLVLNELYKSADRKREHITLLRGQTPTG